MTIYYGNPQIQVILSIEYANAMLSTGINRLDVLNALSKKSLGHVSKMSAILLNETQTKSINLGDAIRKFESYHKDEFQKEFFSAFSLNDTIDIRPILVNLSDKIIKTRDLNAPERAGNITGKMNKTIMILMLPILIFISIIIQSALAEFMSLQLRPVLDYIIYGLMALLLLLLVSEMRDI